MPKDRAVNPATAQRKADKQKALKKSKATIQAQRHEKLARRNPERLQRQIDSLRDAEQSGKLRDKDKKTLEQLEKDVKAVRKAREVLGDRAPQFGRSGEDRGERGGGRGGGGGSSSLGKRRRDGRRVDGNGGQESEGEGDETDEDVRRIPMPRDTPPPIPRPQRERPDPRGNPNEVPIANHEGPHPLPAKPKTTQQTTYEAAPQVRDLRKEAVSGFIPAAVQRQLAGRKGAGTGVNSRLMEPEEADALEREGLRDAERVAQAEADELSHRMMQVEAVKGLRLGEEDDMGDVDESLADLEREEAAFQREVRNVEMEEVEDEDA
ncbi:MAG: hypothetical protein M1820_007454 [Bogoriella megaspora]|nr:MAG: hypothetical protein M1820_007454 [Bogoriella megaspora]